MKKLEELGISHAPWTVPPIDNDFVMSADGDNVCQVQWIAEDAHLIAASPDMYEALREAVKSYCEGCNDFVNGDQRCDPCECPARKWRAALAKASGESEVVK